MLGFFCLLPLLGIYGMRVSHNRRFGILLGFFLQVHIYIFLHEICSYVIYSFSPSISVAARAGLNALFTLGVAALTVWFRNRCLGTTAGYLSSIQKKAECGLPGGIIENKLRLGKYAASKSRNNNNKMSFVRCFLVFSQVYSLIYSHVVAQAPRL